MWSRVWLQVTFAYATGPLAWSVIAFRNSLVFHSVDKVTDVISSPRAQAHIFFVHCNNVLACVQQGLLPQLGAVDPVSAMCSHRLLLRPLRALVRQLQHHQPTSGVSFRDACLCHQSAVRACPVRPRHAIRHFLHLPATHRLWCMQESSVVLQHEPLFTLQISRASLQTRHVHSWHCNSQYWLPCLPYT